MKDTKMEDFEIVATGPDCVKVVYSDGDEVHYDVEDGLLRKMCDATGEFYSVRLPASNWSKKIAPQIQYEPFFLDHGETCGGAVRRLMARRPLATFYPTDERVAILSKFEHFGKKKLVVQFVNRKTDTVAAVVEGFVRDYSGHAMRADNWDACMLGIGQEYYDEDNGAYLIVHKTNALSGEVVYVGYNSEYDFYVADLSTTIDVLA